MWRTKNIYSGILKGTIKVDEKFTRNVPQWKGFDTWGNSWLSRVAWIALYILLYVYFAPSAWFFLLIPIHIAMGPIHGVIVNWFAHKYGKINFRTENTSKNLFKVDWLMFGEGYHNNHHKYPSRSNFAIKKGEFDLCFPIIFMLGKLKVITMNK
jgi:stearoyl-CoA desaturase (delta-9 desaturase)